MPVTVQGPDGNSYQFPDGTDKAAAIAYFKKKGITGTPAAQPEKPPGFIQRLGEGTGVPTSKEGLKAMEPSTAEKIIGPPALAAKALYGIGKNLYEQGGKSFDEITDAAKNILEGGPVGANIGKAGAAGSDFLLRGVLGPVGGAPIQAWGEDLSAGNYFGAAGDALAVVVNAMMLRSARPLPDKKLLLRTPTKVSKIAFAADLPVTLDPEAVRAVLPDLSRARGVQGAPRTLGELATNIKEAKASINGEVGKSMFRLRGQKFSTQPIADAIREHITSDMGEFVTKENGDRVFEGLTEEGQRIGRSLDRAASEFDDKAWTAEQFHGHRVRKNAELHSFYQKGSQAQYRDLKTNIGLIVDKTATDTIRDIIYPQMDQAANVPQGYYRDLLTRHGTLIEMGTATSEENIALAMKTEKIAGAPRFQQQNLSMYMAGTAPHPGISLHRLHNVFKKPNPAAIADSAVKRAFSGRTSAKAYVASYPVRQLFTDLGIKSREPKSKPPGQQLRDLKEMTNNPNLPVGVEP